jgi:hypothetical protein
LQSIRVSLDASREQIGFRAATRSAAKRRIKIRKIEISITINNLDEIQVNKREIGNKCLGNDTGDNQRDAKQRYSM